MNEIVLNGCKASSLTGYLKALGVFHLVSEQVDTHARGYWNDNTFVLASKLDEGSLQEFFLDRYIPSPIISPWNGRAGFLDGGDLRKGPKLLKLVETSKGNRLSGYRAIISSLKQLPSLQRLDTVRARAKELSAKKKGDRSDTEQAELSQINKEQTELKELIIQSIRSTIDDSYLSWIDVCWSIVDGKPFPAPLIGGSGGNEGSMDFSINHLELLTVLIDINTDAPTILSKRLLPAALLGHKAAYKKPASLNMNLGFFDAIASGGYNMSSGFHGDSMGNAWDNILTLEGILLFASAVTRKFEDAPKSQPSFPFSVSANAASQRSTSTAERTRQEQWLPLWGNPAKLPEIETILSEGRVTSGKANARDGLDMLNALASIGTSRGISSFARYGFYERRGDSFVAIHMGNHRVPEIQQDNWILQSLSKDNWLQRFRWFAESTHTPARFKSLHHQLETMLFSLSDGFLIGQQPKASEVQELIKLLGSIQSALSSATSSWGKVPPIPQLAENWVLEAQDHSPAFRIATALAGLYGTSTCALPLRSQLFPVERSGNRWVDGDTRDTVRIYSGTKGRLIDTLIDLLEHRLELNERLKMGDKPLRSSAGATLDDLAEFLQNPDIDQRINELLPGLSLCRIPLDVDHARGEAILPSAYALMKLAITPDRTLREIKINHRPLLRPQDRLPIPKGMVAQLAAGNANNRATRLAWRRLRASGLAPVFGAPETLPAVPEMNARRTAAALLIPLRFGSTAALTRNVLIEPDSESVSI